MKNKLIVITVLVYLILSSSKLFAQTAAFTFSPQYGCAPLIVSFTDLSIGATSWNWDFGNGNTSLSPNPSITYITQGIFIITLSINGGASIVSDTIVVDSIPNQPDTIFGTPFSCVGTGGVGMYYVNPASDSTTYVWTNPPGTIILSGQNTSSIRLLWQSNTGGPISVYASNECGTSSTLAIDPALVGLDTSITAIANTLTSNALHCTYQWIECPGMSILAGDTNQTFTPLVNGSYAVIITSEECVDTSDCWTIVGTGVSFTEMNESSISIFPNPTSNSFSIKINASVKKSLLQIINPIGGRLYTKELFGKDEYLVDEDLASGIYFVSITDGERNVVRKLIVE